MGKRGPAKTPTMRLVRRGSRRIGDRSGEPETVGIPAKPDFLKGRASTMFDSYCDRLLAAGIIGELDDLALARLCILQDSFLIAYKAKDLKSMLKLTDSIRRLESKFGLTPSDRADMNISKTEKPDKYFG